MSIDDKILTYEALPGVMNDLRSQGKSIVHCHGTFDLLHPGHVIHFEEAAALGDVLVVTVTGEQHVNKGPGRPYFNDALRLRSIASLAFVDYVAIVPYPAAVEVIDAVQPHIYCKGKEYEDPENDLSGNIGDDVRAVEAHGGRIAYVGSIVFSSTRLLNRHFDPYPAETKQFLEQVLSQCDKDRFVKEIEDFSNLKVLVIGDIIFDRYSTVNVQGLTSKNRILSGRFTEEDTQAGGALAVFRHVRQFTPHVKMLSLVGTEPWVEESLSHYLHPDEDQILRISDFTTVVKQRFVEPVSSGKELSKLFSVNYIDAQHPGRKVQEAVCERLADQIRHFDLVLVMDFGHGLMEESVRRLVENQSRFMALNCQTNSNNHGFNIINRQYHRADSFSLDQAEISIACGKREMDFPAELENLREQLGSHYAWLTRGVVETIGLKKGHGMATCLPLEVNVLDTIGAGDAFCALASLAAARDLPIEVATFMGQLAGAQAVKIVGNADPIQKASLLKAGTTMLSS